MKRKYHLSEHLMHLGTSLVITGTIMPCKDAGGTVNTSPAPSGEEAIFEGLRDLPEGEIHILRVAISNVVDIQSKINGFPQQEVLDFSD